MKYRFKTLEEFEKEFEKNEHGSFDIGDYLFIPEMHHLCGVELPDEVAKKILNADRGIRLDLGDLVPDEDNHLRFTKEMITPVEETEQPNKFYPFAEEVEMLVWDDMEEYAVKRTVFGRKNGMFVAWDENPYYIVGMSFKNAKPLPETVTVTMQEIAEWKGVDVEQINVEG